MIGIFKKLYQTLSNLKKNLFTTEQESLSLIYEKKKITNYISELLQKNAERLVRDMNEILLKYNPWEKEKSTHLKTIRSICESFADLFEDYTEKEVFAIEAIFSLHKEFQSDESTIISDAKKKIEDVLQTVDDMVTFNIFKIYDHRQKISNDNVFFQYKNAKKEEKTEFFMRDFKYEHDIEVLSKEYMEDIIGFFKKIISKGELGEKSSFIEAQRIANEITVKFETACTKRDTENRIKAIIAHISFHASSRCYQEFLFMSLSRQGGQKRAGVLFA